MKCYLSNRISEQPGGNFEFSELDCEISETTELIESESTNAEFYLDKTINYGEILIVVFLSIFAIYFICEKIGKFVFHHID